MADTKYRVVEDDGHLERVARTADVVSQVRSQEGLKKRPLFSDPFASLFATPEAQKMLARGLKRWPFFADYLSVRERFFDDQLSVLFCQEALAQLVILGAGNDMRAARLPFLKHTTVFEVDLPDKIATKQAILMEAVGQTPGNVVRIKADVGHPGWMQRLEERGFDANKNTVFLLQGLIYYMNSTGIDTLFDGLAKYSSSGHTLLLDQVSEDLSEVPPYPRDLMAYLAERRFSLTEHALLGDLTAHYMGKAHREKWWVIVATKEPSR